MPKDNSKENSVESLEEEQVSQDTSSFVESLPNVDKETIFPVNKKVEFTKPKNHEKPVKKSVSAISKHNFSNQAQLTAKRHRAVNTTRFYSRQVNAVRGKPQHDDKGFVDSGCSRHMTGNIAYLFDFKNLIRGYGFIGGRMCISYGGKATQSLFLMHKKYCLVVTDDYNRFTWVFFLTTKDETSEILKNIIKEIKNLVDRKVKIIRNDNGTEFKNKVMDDFYGEKGIKREYSVARTPQQNGIAERRNRTLIEATRTILADSKLPTTFWAEVVSTACYV
ncbi:putative ribonuclease H-like domain-containing protein [Tanacetum coccineum]